MKEDQKVYGKIVCSCGQVHKNFYPLPLDHTPITCSCGTVLMVGSAGQEKAGLEHVDLRCEFVKADHWFIDVGKITHSYIDSAHMALSLMGGQSLIFDNDDLVADVSGNVLKGPLFRALSDFLRERFKAEDVLTPVDKVYSRELREFKPDKEKP